MINIKEINKKIDLKSLIKTIKNKKAELIKLIIPLFIILSSFVACSVVRGKISKTVYLVFELSDEIRTAYSTKPDFRWLSTASLIEQDVLSPKFIDNGAITLNGNTGVLVGTGIDGDMVMPSSQTFDIVLKKLNKAQCMAYAEFALKEDQLIKIEKISIFNNIGAFSFEWGGLNPLPIKKYSTKDLCAEKENTILWTFK